MHGDFAAGDSLGFARALHCDATSQHRQLVPKPFFRSPRVERTAAETHHHNVGREEHHTARADREARR